MNVKVKELQVKLEKSQRRSMMIASLCGDEKFVAKVLKLEPSKISGLFNKWTEHWESEKVDDETAGDIANAAIVALKEMTRGRDSLQRAQEFVEALTSLLFESKDNLDDSDRVNAIVQLRIIANDVLPEKFHVESKRSQPASDEKIKSFSARKTSQSFHWHKALRIASRFVKNADTEAGKKELDKKEAEQAALILAFIGEHEELKKMMCSFAEPFANWIAEQLFGMKPEVVEACGTEPGDDVKKTVKLFNQYAIWLKQNDPNGYVKYLAESTDEEPPKEETPKPENKTAEKEEPKKIEDKQDKSEKEEDQVENKYTKFIGMSPYEIYQACKGDADFMRCWVS